MKYFKNIWSLVLTGSFLVFSLIILSQCQVKDNWRYEVHGYVIHKGKPHPAVWYTDTIEIGDNFVSYKNSDGSEVVIAAPYTLIDHKYQKVIEDTKPAF